MPNPDEIKTKLQEMKSAFGDHVEANDKKLKEISEKGEATAETLKEAKAALDGLVELKNTVETMQKAYDRDRIVDTLKGENGKAKTERYSKFIKGAEMGDATATEYKKYFFDEKGQYDEEKAEKHENAFAMYMRTAKDSYMQDYPSKSMNVVNDVAGGYLVSPVMGEMIVHTIAEFSPFHQHVDEMTITANEIDFPTTNRRVGAARKHELAARPATTAPTFGEITIKPEDLYAAPEVSQRMLDLRPDMESWLSKVIADEFIITEANEIANGTGVGEGRGFLTYASGTGVGQIEQVNSGSAATIADFDKIKDLQSKLKPVYRQNAKWFANRATFNTIGQLKDGNGNYLWQPSNQVGQAMMLIGHGIVEAEDMPDLAADSLSLALADMKRGYKWVIMPGVRILRDPYSNKPFVQMHTTKRSNGAAVVNEAFKILKSAV